MTVSSAFDVIAFVTRGDFPGRRGSIGDYLSLGEFQKAYPDLSICVLEFNDPDTRVQSDGAMFSIAHPRFGTADVGSAKLVLYMPVSFEPEDVALQPGTHRNVDAVFGHRQWRVITEFLEVTLSRHPNCINDPRRARLACNKLAQLRLLKEASIPILPIRVADITPSSMAGPLVRKNLSEGAIRSPGDISNTRLASESNEPAGYPAIFQPYVMSDHEMRFYVLGTDIIPVRLRRRLEANIVDVREMKMTPDDVSISAVYERYHPRLLEACRLLGLRYAVIDAIPSDDELLILEVNPSGVWTNLPAGVGRHICRKFHEFLYACLACQ